MAKIERLKSNTESDHENDLDNPESQRIDNEKMGILADMSEWMGMLDEKDPEKVNELLAQTEKKDAERMEFLREVANGKAKNYELPNENLT